MGNALVNLYRARVDLTGFSGAPGVSTWYSYDTATLSASIRAFWQGVSSIMPSSFRAATENSGDSLDETTGMINGTWLNAVETTVSGTGVAAYAAPVGACVTWLTGTYVHGRRLRGRTFVVPLTTGSYESDGTLTAATLTTIGTAAANYITAQSVSFAIWSRPFAGTPATATRAANPARVGSSGLVTAYRVTDKVAVLRTRRD